MRNRDKKNQTPAFKANLLMEVFKGGQVRNLDREHADPNRTQKWKQQRLNGLVVFFVLGFLLPGLVSAQSSQSLPWTELLQGRAIAIVRHAIAPGFGDPPHFSIHDCGTQRNLSEEGRIQARRIGDFFRKMSVKNASVYSSQWCRCLETAKLFDLGDVRAFPALNSFFQDNSTENVQTLEVKRLINTLPAGRPTILVTHQVNITALTGVFPSAGEIVIFRLAKNGHATVLGRFTP